MDEDRGFYRSLFPQGIFGLAVPSGRLYADNLGVKKIQAFIGVVTFFVLAASGRTAVADPHFAEIDSLLKKTRGAWNTPGMAVAVVEHDEITHVFADGFSDLENQTRAGAKTMWRIASVSKPIAATAIMQLVEQGAVRLDEPIWTYIPWYPRKAGNVITVRHILTHTSGIRHYDYAAGEKESLEYYPTVEAGSHVNGVDREPLQFTPGTSYLYSTYAYLLLAGIVEKASGLSYEAYLAEKIFVPAGMKTACLDRNRELIPNRARFYRKGDNGKEVFNAPYVDSSYKWAAGGIMSTVEDLARYAIALDTGKLLAPATTVQVLTPFVLPNGASTGYGLGWHVETDKEGRRWAYHSGGATGGAAFVLRAPADGFAIVLLCNLERPGDLKKLSMDMARSLLPQK
jgi:serine beta-lactamase-like protein LACTB